MNDEKSFFEYSLFRDGTPDNIPEMDDIDFIINTLVNLSIFRPRQYELIINLHRIYSKRKGFREKFLERALYRNGSFINVLIKENIYSFEEVSDLHGVVNDINAIIALSYNINQTDYEETNICQNSIDIPEESLPTDYSYGTIEYFLKYDDINEIHRIYQDPGFFQYEANMIETDRIMDLTFSLLGFCGFFGSIKCFKFFLASNKFAIDQSVIECVVCGGSIEIFALCLQKEIDISCFMTKLSILASCYNNLDLLRYFKENGADLTLKDEIKMTPLHFSSRYGHYSVVEYLINQNAEINAKNSSVEILYLMRLLFI